MLDLVSPFLADGVILGGSLAPGLVLDLGLAPEVILMTGSTLTVSSKLPPPALPLMTEKSRVLSGRVASSLVGVEHAFLLVPAARSGVLRVVLEMLEPGLTALGPKGRDTEAVPGLVFRLENLEVRRVEGSTRGLMDFLGLPDALLDFTGLGSR